MDCKTRFDHWQIGLARPESAMPSPAKAVIDFLRGVRRLDLDEIEVGAVD